MTSEVTQAATDEDRLLLAKIFHLRDEWASAARLENLNAPLADHEREMVECIARHRLTAQSGEGRSGAGGDEIRVPREPTDDMVQAGLYQVGVGGDEWAMVYQIWVDMFDRLTLDGGCTQSLPAALNARQSGEGERLRPMEEAPKDGTYILAIYKSLNGYASQLEGRVFAVRHEGKAPSDYDLGWALFPGHGGVPDKCFYGWIPIPAALRATDDAGGA